MIPRFRRYAVRRLLLLCAVFLMCDGSGAQAAEDGLSLITETWARYRRVKSEREESEILIVNAPQVARFSRADVERMLEDTGFDATHKRTVRHVRYGPDRTDKLHVLFSLPPEDAGLGILVRKAAGGQDGMWLYMPGYIKVRRIAAGSKKRMAGTDLLYEDVRDLVGERTEQFTYEKLRMDDVDGRACHVVAARPKAGTTSAYSRRDVWLDSERLFPLKIDFYDESGGLWKRLHNSDIREMAPGTHRADFMEMRDLQRNRTTLVLITKRAVGVEIPERVFTQDYLIHPGDD